MRLRRRFAPEERGIEVEERADDVPVIVQGCRPDEPGLKLHVVFAKQPRLALQPAHEARLDQAVAVLVERPSILRLAYQPAPDESPELGDARIAALKAALLERWKAQGRSRDKALFNLDIEVERVPALLNR